ncbi:MAG: phosphate ABC transporter permease PstA [Pseudomonadota bacterium]
MSPHTARDTASGTRQTIGWFAQGEPWIWLQAAALAASLCAVVGLLGLIAVNGLGHFWPADVVRFETRDGTAVYGERFATDALPYRQYVESGGEPFPAVTAEVVRHLVKTGNRRQAPPDFRWLFEHDIVRATTPAELLVVERTEWGNAYGRPLALRLTDVEGEQTVERAITTPAEIATRLHTLVRGAADARAAARAFERDELNRLNYERALAIEGRQRDADDDDARIAALDAAYAAAERRLFELRASAARGTLQLGLPDGTTLDVPLATIIDAWQPNQMNAVEKLARYLRALWLFLSGDPREANTEGGIFPAIFGTVLMVMLMAVLVTPFGVIAALYLHEYARQGPLVRLIRICVNNLAGVPSIVYGVFGLGFLVYFLGGGIDQLLFSDSLPAPTFGTPGLLWASLTLALLTVPVVIVSTEEGLARIPRALRDGSLALGATRAETLFRIVIPAALPTMLTGVILAVARAAGEVAPLMLVGVVKLAPALPVDGVFPYLHLERKFMHLGFHIYDVGFQSPNVEAAQPLVYATALLLVLIVIGLNLGAIGLRNRLQRRYRDLEAV